MNTIAAFNSNINVFDIYNVFMKKDHHRKSETYKYMINDKSHESVSRLNILYSK